MRRIPLAQFLMLLLTCQTARTALAGAEPESATLPNSAITPEPGNTTGVPDANFLVQQLGAGSYAQREAAATTLIESGSAARPALETGAQSPDYEIRSRSERLLAALDQLTLRRAIETIRQGQELLETDRQALPFYEVYCQQFGHRPESLEVYAEYLLDDFGFLKELEWSLQQAEPRGVIAAIERKIAGCERLLNANLSRDPLDQLLFDDDLSVRLQGIIAATAFTQSDLRDESWVALNRLLCTNLTYRKKLQETTPAGTVRRGLLGQCCLTARSTEAQKQALQLTNYYGCREASTQLASRVFAALEMGPADFSPLLLGCAIEAIALFGNDRPEDLALLIPLLDDQAPLLTGTETSLTSEVGDAALLAIARLTGQNPTDYQVGPQCRFPSQAVRLESQAKLRRWLVEQRGVEPIRLFPPSPTTPAEFLTRALNAVEDEVIIGSRFRVLTSNAFVGGFMDDRLDVTLGAIGLQFRADLFVETGQGTGSLGMPVLSPWGRTFALIRFDKGVRTLSLTAVDTTEAGKVIETRLQGTTPELFSLLLRETTGELITEIRYQQQAEGVELSVREQTNLEEHVQYDQTGRATSLLELRRTEPELFQRGLAPLLGRLKINLPSE